MRTRQAAFEAWKRLFGKFSRASAARREREDCAPPELHQSREYMTRDLIWALIMVALLVAANIVLVVTLLVAMLTR